MGTSLASPFSTGGGGYRFETHIQASFVTLMLTGGCAPTLPCWPIVEIKLQVKSHGFETDDFVVVVEHPATSQRCKLLCQIKHSISFVESDPDIESVLQAAWTDFNNKKIFSQRVDKIALIVGHLNGADHKALSFLTEHARASLRSEDFFLKLETARISPDKARGRLSFIRKVLTSANDAVHLPPLPEQRAIAAVLSEMDDEITALEKRRDKTLRIKEGMMQQLLTGRVRLVPRAGADARGATS